MKNLKIINQSISLAEIDELIDNWTYQNDLGIDFVCFAVIGAKINICKVRKFNLQPKLYGLPYVWQGRRDIAVYIINDLSQEFGIVTILNIGN